MSRRIGVCVCLCALHSALCRAHEENTHTSRMYVKFNYIWIWFYWKHNIPRRISPKIFYRKLLKVFFCLKKSIESIQRKDYWVSAGIVCKFNRIQLHQPSLMSVNSAFVLLLCRKFYSFQPKRSNWLPMMATIQITLIYLSSILMCNSKKNYIAHCRFVVFFVCLLFCSDKWSMLCANLLVPIQWRYFSAPSVWYHRRWEQHFQ